MKYERSTLGCKDCKDIGRVCGKNWKMRRSLYHVKLLLTMDSPTKGQTTQGQTTKGQTTQGQTTQGQTTLGQTTKGQKCDKGSNDKRSKW